MDDVLPFMRKQTLEATPDSWPAAWLLIERITGRVVGAAGIGPHERRSSVLGYGLYAAFGGRGFATEASRALVAWAFTHPEIESAIATSPPWHPASRRVAARLGMTEVGTAVDPDEGEVLVYMLRREP